jgi:hypothetical protein
MQNFFQKLFKSNSSETNQPQREAIVDLCILGMYSDPRVSLAEQDFLKDEFMQLQWESVISFDLYLQGTIAKVRSLNNDPLKVTELIQDIDRRLGSNEFKQKAVSELEQLIAADGVIEIEEKFLAQVKTVMGI